MKSSEPKTSSASDFSAAQKTSQLKETFRRLCQNKAALVGLIFLIVLVLLAIFADVLFNYQATCVKQNIAERLQWPSVQHWFGTDEFGRDLLARVVHGSRVSLSISFIAVAFGLFVGGILGAVAGFFGGAADNVIMRVCDVFLAVPMMLMAIVIVAALGSSITNLVIALAISSVPTFARIVRSAVLTVRDMEYVEAAKAIGVKTGGTIFHYILPNCMGPIIVQTTLRIAATISNTAALSFLGLGVVAPRPEWGALLSGGRNFIRDSGYLACIPGICIMLTILALNLLGDGLRDALDPRLK
ncbi:MAG: ABC transporter permease [Oscillospiraceae bacterium]|nr:ABC transporter permease [Oscillospiraceae bacterium]